MVYFASESLATIFLLIGAVLFGGIINNSTKFSLSITAIIFVADGILLRVLAEHCKIKFLS